MRRVGSRRREEGKMLRVRTEFRRREVEGGGYCQKTKGGGRNMVDGGTERRLRWGEEEGE